MEARRQPQPQPSVDDLLDDVVERVIHGASVAVPLEVERIIRQLSKDNMESLIDWFEDHMREVLGRTLQRRLKHVRSSARARRSVEAFKQYRDNPDEGTGPLDVPYYTGEAWKPLGDMLRSDWEFVIEQRRQQGRAAMFEIALAKVYLRKLPNSTIKVREVVTEEEALKIESRAETQAEKMMGQL